ncbi:MAG: HAMP domain-containing protein [Thermodesulfobacteriota bacterium]|nr:HAMP domain-containing protein [Thermodesulfobacteriota bacterium]
MSWAPFYSLRSKLMLGIALVLIVTMGVYAYMDITYHEKIFLNEQKKKAFDISDTVMKSIEYPMLDGEMGDVQEILERVNALKDLDVAHLCDLEGLIKYSGKRKSIGRGTRSEITKEALRTRSLVKGLEVRKSEDIFRYAMPVVNEKTCHKCHGAEKRILGVLTVGFAWEPISQKIRVYRNKMVVQFLICLAFVIVLIIGLLHRMIIVPLGMLTKAARVIATGDITQEIPASRSKDEVGALTNAFREMQQSLRQCYYKPGAAHEK